MDKEKKKWETPKLICLYRGRPEEAVLQTCKGPLMSDRGPSSKCSKPDSACWTEGGGT